jgi:hypothetical protein
MEGLFCETAFIPEVPHSFVTLGEELPVTSQIFYSFLLLSPSSAAKSLLLTKVQEVGQSTMATNRRDHGDLPTREVSEVPAP